MEFIFFVEKYDFSGLRKHARLTADKLGVKGLYLEFDKPSPSIKAILTGSERVPYLEIVPDDLGAQEMVQWNGLWVSAKSDPEWSFVVTKWQVNGHDYWSIKTKFSVKNVDLESVAAIFSELVESISPDLGFGFDDVATPYNVSYFSNSLGPWAGLRDLYWFNYYGRKYLDLIGVERLKKIPEIVLMQSWSDGIFFVIDKKYLPHRRRIINQIGEEYFIHKSITGGAEEKVGILQLFKTVYKLSQNKDAKVEMAERRPSLD